MVYQNLNRDIFYGAMKERAVYEQLLKIKIMQQETINIETLNKKEEKNAACIYNWS